MPWTPSSEDELLGSSPLREAPAQRRPTAVSHTCVCGIATGSVVAPESTSVRPMGATDAVESFPIRGGLLMFLTSSPHRLRPTIAAAVVFLIKWAKGLP